MMKAFKAEQKNIFCDVITRIADKKSCNYEVPNPNLILKGYVFPYQTLNLEVINKEFSLFQFTVKKDKTGKKKKAEEHYTKFIKLTENIQTKKHAKNEKGNFFKYYFSEYKNFCNQYKNIAQKRGKLLAQIKGIDREKQEALQTDFWALIYCQPDKKQLWLVPKEKRKEAREFVYDDNNRQKYTQGNLEYLCSFESLTMRALHKLCFAEQSTFVKGMLDKEDKSSKELKELEKLKQLQKEAKEFKTNGDENKLKIKEQKELNFFKELLKSGYIEEKLCLKNFDLSKPDKAQDLKEFELSLEKACYHIKEIPLTEDEKKDFLDKFDVTVLDISSYDLEERNKNIYQPPYKESENRLHTDLWHSFWKNRDNKSSEEIKVKGFYIGQIHLNPEIKIRYRKASDDLKFYFKKRKFPDDFKHRRLKDQFTVQLTLALNTGQLYEDLAFAKPEDLLNKIHNFNQKLNKDMDIKTAWKYGIDRGQIELATLCLVKFGEDDTSENKTRLKPNFKKFECWTLKDCNYSKEYTTKKGETKNRYAIKNLSYFMDEKYLNDEKILKKESVSCLDLTVAKVVKGRIITNGDVMTYLKLKKEVAKRRLYDLYYGGKGEKIDGEAKLEWSNLEHGNTYKERQEGVLNITTSEGEKTVYWYRKKYKGILIDQKRNIRYSKESIQNALIHYLDELRQKGNNSHAPSISKINHLRDAITANMVGVICFLQKSYPGFIILEDLKEEQINRHFFNNNENISRRLENALYNKFQSLSLVPPHVKDIIHLREDNREELSQIGAITFVPEKDTSNNCPYCEKTQKKDNNLKFLQHRFICKDCGFDTYLFKPKEDWVENYNPEVKIDNRKKFSEFKDIDDPDKLAAYNVAKRSVNRE